MQNTTWLCWRDPSRLWRVAAGDVTQPPASCDRISLLLRALLAARGQGQAKALGQGLLLLSLLSARLLAAAGEALPATLHSGGATGLSQTGLGLIDLLQALSAAGVFNAAKPLQILTALGRSEACEGIHQGTATSAFLRLAESSTSAGTKQQGTGQSQGETGMQGGMSHG